MQLCVCIYYTEGSSKLQASIGVFVYGLVKNLDKSLHPNNLNKE